MTTKRMDRPERLFPLTFPGLFKFRLLLDLLEFFKQQVDLVVILTAVVVQYLLALEFSSPVPE